MVNDGGLINVLQTSELVSNGLYALSHRPAHHQQNSQNNAAAASGSSAASGIKRKPSRSLSEISGNTDGSIRMDLGHHTSDELGQVVGPLIEEMSKLDAAALLSLNPTKNTSQNDGGAVLDPQKGLRVPPIHDRVTPQYSRRDGPNIVRYLHVKEVPHKYSVGIFIFPPNTQIPLHDHPDMVVISRVLYGELQVQSYNILECCDSDKHGSGDGSGHHYSSSTRKKKSSRSTSASKPPPSSQSTIRSSLNKIKELVSRALSFHEGDESDNEEDDEFEDQEEIHSATVLHAQRNLSPMGVVHHQPQSGADNSSSSSSIISAPSVTCLYPHEGNCHSFVAGPNGAAVIDVLLPPYDSDDDRDCTFYQASQDEDRQELFTLTPIDQPDDFRCLSGAYGRFGACKEYAEDDDNGQDHDAGSALFSSCTTL